MAKPPLQEAKLSYNTDYLQVVESPIKPPDPFKFKPEPPVHRIIVDININISPTEPKPYEPQPYKPTCNMAYPADYLLQNSE